MAKKYIDAEKLAKAIEDKGLNCSFALKMERLDILALIDELQQERPEEPDKSLEEAAEISFDEAYALTEDYRDFLAKGLTENQPRPIGPRWFSEYAKKRFIAGAKWQADQFEKNRLAHCDALSKEDCDRETDFAMEIIEKEHRQPTFTDAINYGMRLQAEKDKETIEFAEDHAYLAGAVNEREHMMKGAVEAYVNTYCDLTAGKSWAEFVVEMPTNNLGDKVKLIIIKDDGKSD